mgnify:FL=1|jgi:hypothetical protein
MDWNKTNIGNTKEIFGYKTKALFHEGYLREIFKERNLSSSKSRQKEVPEESYLDKLLARIQACIPSA